MNSGKNKKEEENANSLVFWKKHEGNINFLIRETKDFIVYIDNALDIEYETSEELDRKIDNCDVKPTHNYVLNLTYRIERKDTRLFNEIEKMFIKKMSGEAIVSSLNFDYVSSIGYILEAEYYYNDLILKDEKRKNDFLFSVMMVMAIPYIIYIFMSVVNYFTRGV